MANCSPLLAVIVGSLPALKLLITSHSTAKRSRYGYGSAGAGRDRQHSNNSGGLRCKSVPLSSLSLDKKSPSGRCPGAGDSQEEILKSANDSQFVLVKHDIVSPPQRGWDPVLLYRYVRRRKSYLQRLPL